MNHKSNYVPISGCTNNSQSHKIHVFFGVLTIWHFEAALQFFSFHIVQKGCICNFLSCILHPGNITGIIFIYVIFCCQMKCNSHTTWHYSPIPRNIAINFLNNELFASNENDITNDCDMICFCFWSRLNSQWIFRTSLLERSEATRWLLVMKGTFQTIFQNGFFFGFRWHTHFVLVKCITISPWTIVV